MKKIIIVTSNSKSIKKNAFTKLVKKYFKSRRTTIDVVGSDDIWIETGKKSKVYADSKDLTKYDLVVFRGISNRHRSLITSVATCLKENEIKFIDGVYGKLGTRVDKFTSLLKISTEVKVPDTIYYSGEINRSVFRKVVKKLKYPVVVKDLYLQRGQGIYLINNQSDLYKVGVLGTKNSYYFQEVIEKKIEYRVLVLGEKIGVFEEKIPVKGEFRANVAQGASEEFLDKNVVPAKIRVTSLKAAKLLDLQIAGVDVVIEKETNDVYIIEVNRGPGLTYDDKISPEFKEIAYYLENI